MKDLIRIGTRDSELAIWQANAVRAKLNEIGVDSTIVFIKSKGDKDRRTPLHQLGTVGVFTKLLDQALIDEEIDLAVHSLKDVPTEGDASLVQAAVLKRDNPVDLLICKENPETIYREQRTYLIATGSIRRKAQWLHRFPLHEIADMRGNVPSRIEKLRLGKMDGTILSAAGIERLGIELENAIELDWMLPAPAQGVVGVFCRKKDVELWQVLATLSDKPTEITSMVERQLLNVLEGGCSAPIGAYSEIRGDRIRCEACLLDTEGKKHIRMSLESGLEDCADLGKKLALLILEAGGKEIIKDLKGNG